MFRSISTGNKTINNKVVEKNYDMHLERLKKIKQSTSQTFQLQNHNSDIIKNASFLRNHDRKKVVQKELYHIKVDRENKILLDKMTKIVNNPNHKNTFYNFSSVGPRNEGRGKSLNEHVRKVEIEKIAIENHDIIHRIQNQSSFYSVQKWEKDFKMRETYLKNMYSQHNSFDKNSRKPIQFQISETPMRKILITQKTKTRTLHKRSQSSELLSPSNASESKTSKSTRKLVLHKKEVEIENDLYCVEFFLFERKFQIALKSLEDSEIKIIVLDEHQGKQLLIENNNSYDKIISKISFKDGNPVIKDMFEKEEEKKNIKIEIFNDLQKSSRPLSSSKPEPEAGIENQDQ